MFYVMMVIILILINKNANHVLNIAIHVINKIDIQKIIGDNILMHSNNI